VNPGLRALLEAAQISANRPPSSGEVGFRIAPRINAAGRMDVARDVIELFSVKDPVARRNSPQNSTSSTPSVRRRAKNPEIGRRALRK
jgi:single-stranded DNA-specific DHH superfamily exonuclease